LSNLVALLHEAWESLLADYAQGKTLIKNERNLECAFSDICMRLMEAKGMPLMIENQELHMGRKVDVRLGHVTDPLLIQLKFYHDKADWKESSSMQNAVESDLKYAKGHDNIYVGIVDAIPSSSRMPLPFRLHWRTIEINADTFNRFYAKINPTTSPRRERIQNALLANGSEL
jgi:hypothetical protein